MIICLFPRCFKPLTLSLHKSVSSKMNRFLISSSLYVLSCWNTSCSVNHPSLRNLQWFVVSLLLFVDLNDGSTSVYSTHHWACCKELHAFRTVIQAHDLPYRSSPSVSCCDELLLISFRKPVLLVIRCSDEFLTLLLRSSNYWAESGGKLVAQQSGMGMIGSENRREKGGRGN